MLVVRAVRRMSIAVVVLFTSMTAAAQVVNRVPGTVPRLTIGAAATACQQLNARMNGCPNPTQILVDPDQGYSCGQAADPKAVAEAWSRQCAQVTSPGPDGRTPCAPFTPLGGDGRVYAGGAQNLCADTRALIDGGSDMCYVTMDARNPLTQSIEQLIAVISKQFGGPIIVLPPPRPRGAAPEPRPRPRPTPGT